AKTAAESKAAAAEEAARVLKETHESQIQARVSEVRVAMEADKLQAVNAANAARSEDNRKMSEKLADLQRKLDQPTADQIAENADHAILSTRSFPEGMKQLDVLDGVILANPARIVALVQVVREHIVKCHALRMSNEEKALKSAELYAFITSTQYTDLLDRI